MIIHIDLDAFFCAVEELENPQVSGLPFAVGGQPDKRGVVLSCSYAARKFGVHSAMPMVKAQNICPGLLIIKPKHQKYSIISKNVMVTLRSYTNLIEQVSIDEAYLDISHTTMPIEQIAKCIQATVRKNHHLPCSLGVATNKLVAKMATDTGKHNHSGDGYPNVITVISPGEEANFIAPLPIIRIPGIGPKTDISLRQLGYAKIGDLANESETKLVQLLGKWGAELHRKARGIDNSLVTTDRKIKSISQEITFQNDITDRNRINDQLKILVHKVCSRLQNHGLSGTTIQLKLRYYDFKTITRQITISSPTNQESLILENINNILEKNWDNITPIRLIGVGISKFSDVNFQLNLWDSKIGADADLSETIDQLQRKYGKQIIHLGTIKNT
jgi:DNA polymerase-4